MGSTHSWAGAPGVPDEMFERAERVPITKEEVRAIQVCKARVRPGHAVYDIGCGSGSITVEAAIQAGPSGRVTGIDRDPAAVELAGRNVASFGLGNVTLTLGEAPACLAGLGPADAVFIGGAGGATAGIMEACRPLISPGGRIVAAAVMIETAHAALKAAWEHYDSPEVIQVAISRGRRAGGGTMMLARNPVYIISASAPS
ncbi:MAG: precorrin-6Y C5,15-methyltransferase (decarboxylating) subunit CbiT [Nitrosopumilus sp.]|nr:precorrin-6Y C5,15-methyltransferase (decarboxylating) subunit CbiT [Nitrosopumilus sp.]MDA7941034.1 precorrin-6Y C5,15-methyltransferase (decarboxylating) subunit CbiT [Nitrosopumilus sp.]MDA7942568.1 precorrin-6Y C5,15-methyltransferase (decarboxylating) subunit CbiT [Nitrosopumilus sp.]MDA7944471.1 precorrin-6Y C5,15-methyltransferase (decarboxylating) subunit CbiT [Nitrosopumilus sp.]MDA7954223.1 precorrin-6Y C5,15-methyltransferase (decarboxylating) subunit CbiT [Nitrosopumilus sp.]